MDASGLNHVLNPVSLIPDVDLRLAASLVYLVLVVVPVLSIAKHVSLRWWLALVITLLPFGIYAIAWMGYRQKGVSPWFCLLQVVPVLDVVLLYVLACTAWPQDPADTHYPYAT